MRATESQLLQADKRILTISSDKVPHVLSTISI